jgi:copper chaperone CopZ
MFVIPTRIIMKHPIALSLLVFAMACSEASTPTGADMPASVARTEQEVAITSGEPMATADLGVNGMTCAMMCGGAIKEAMAKLPGVNGTQIQFTDADQMNHAVVTYDPAKVSDADMVKAIEALYDGQYKVLSVNVTKQVLHTGNVDAPADTKAEGDVNATALPDVVLPSLIALLSRLVRI